MVAAASVPAGSRKLVQGLKEIVNLTEAEIYAAPRECGMDADGRLVSQVEDSSADVSAAAAANFQSLSLHNDELAAKKTAEDNPAVIIPDHLQVTETERVSLSFGSFGSGAFSGLLPRKATDRNVEFPAREESAPVDQLDARNQDYYESGAVTSQADENLEAMLGANMENVDAPSVSEANELRQDVLDPSGLQYYVPSVSSHAYSNTNASQPSTMGDPQGNNQAHTCSHLSNLMIEEVPETRYRLANSSTSRGFRSGADRGGQSNSVHSSSTGNMTSRPPVSGSGTASVNSSQRQTIASSSANKHMVTDGPVSLQSSSGFEHGVPGQLSMSDIVKMGRPQGKASSKPVVTADRGYAGQYPSLPNTNQNLKQSVSMVPPTELDKGLQPAQDSVQVKNHGHSAADSKLPYGTDWSPQDDPTSLPETSGDPSLYEASFQSSTLVTDVVNSHENSHLDENSTFAMRPAPASERHLEPSDGISEYNDGMLNNSSSYQRHNYSYTEQEVEDSSADVSAAAAANFQSLSLHNDELAAKKTAEDNPAVIIPDHLQVTETERVSLSFGSFGSGAFSGLLPRKATDRNVEFPAREESAPVDQLDARNQDYYESGAVTSQADENLEAMLGANMENVDAPSVSEANELRQDVLDPSGLQYYVPSVSSHAYSNTNASQPSTMGDPQGNNQAHTRSHLSNLMIEEVPETRYRLANSSTSRGFRSGADRGGQSNSVHSSSTGNMTSRPPVSGSGTASVNSSQRQTIASSSANKHMVTDGPVSLQSSSGFEHGVPGQLSMSDIVKMGRPQGKASSKPVVTDDRGYAGQYPSLPNTNQNLKQSVSMVPPTELDKGLQPAQDLVQVKNHGHSAADSKLPYGTDWSPQDDPASLPETSGDPSLYEASFQSSTLVTDVVNSHENSHLDENSTFAMRPAPASERHLEPSDGISEYNDGMLNNSSSYQRHNYSYTEQEAAAANFQSLSLHNDELAAKKTAEDNPAVIIPDHLQVTETERVSLSFGSFGSGAFSGLLPRKATDRNVEFPAREESAPVDQLDARNQDYYESGAVTSQADENLEAMLGANMENVDAPSVSEANELRQDVLDPSGLQYYVPSVSSHAYSNTNASQPSTMGDPQGNNQAHTRSHLSNLMIEEVPERKIIWDQSRTSLFIHICFQEISQGNMEVGELSDKACETIRQRLFKEGMKCTKSQIRYKWDEVKRLHSFYHNKVLGAKVEVKDEKFWKRILKSRISKKEYKDLIHGPPKDLEHLDFIFGNKIAVESYEKENQERESAESSRDVLTVDLERVTHDAKRFSEQLKMAEDTNKRLQECNSSLQQQNSNLQADASKSGETISKLQKEKSAMMETMAIMRESNSSMGNQLESYRETCNKQQEQIRIFQKQLAVVTKKLKLADVTAIEAMTGYEKQKEKIKYLEERLAQAECQIVEGDKLRKKLHNTILELKGNIRVFCRVRPLLRFDGDSNGPEGASISFPTSVEFAGCGIDLINQGQKLSFSYDKVFDHDASQEDVFVEISQLVQSALDGYKVCIFAYGQTGSGKTYTMMGKPGIDQKGIIPRSLEQIFKTSRFLESQGWNYSMQASMLEIYNETIRDLLTPGRSNSFEMTSNKQYTIKHDPHGNTTVSELTIIDVFGIADVTSLLERASQSRSVGRTQMNEQSSRSHFVFTLKISGSNENTGQHVQGVLNLIDLAGSERLAKSGSTGDRLKETQSINKSLSALSDVIFAIAKGDDHVPFRNSKLTYLLQPCLGGDSKALMFVNISPEASSVGETICSLRFASRVNACEIGIPRR